MTLTLELPEEIATQLTALPEEERNAFSIAAIADALTYWELSTEPEEDDGWIAEVNQTLAEIEAGQTGTPIEELYRQWDAEKAARKAKAAA